MDFEKLPQPYREAVAFFQVYRSCGFSSDDIYAVIAGTDGNVQLSVQLRTQGKDVTAVAGFVKDTRMNVGATWAAVAVALSSGTIPQEQLDAAWGESMAAVQSAELLVVLARKGIRTPVMNKGTN